MPRHVAVILFFLGLSSCLTCVFLTVQRAAYKAQSYGSLKCMACACMQYAEKHDGRLPPMENARATQKALGSYAGTGGYEFWKLPGQGDVWPEVARKSGIRWSAKTEKRVYDTLGLIERIGIIGLEMLGLATVLGAVSLLTQNRRY